MSHAQNYNTQPKSTRMAGGQQPNNQKINQTHNQRNWPRYENLTWTINNKNNNGTRKRNSTRLNRQSHYITNAAATSVAVVKAAAAVAVEAEDVALFARFAGLSVCAAASSSSFTPRPRQWAATLHTSPAMSTLCGMYGSRSTGSAW